MTLRDKCNEEELWAHGVLDQVQNGITVPLWDIKRALFVLGDLVGLAWTD